MNEFESIYDFQNLYDAYLKCRRGKKTKDTVAKFEYNATEQLLRLQRDIQTKQYKMSPYHIFQVYEPKERTIMSNGFRDKILQRSLCDNVLNPMIWKHLIYDNYASQDNKGTHLGLKRLSGFLSAYYRKYGCNGWVLKCDISKYFYSIDHDILKQKLRRYVHDEDVWWLINQIIDSTEGKGVPIGNQTSQTFAIFYLNNLDHLIKDQMGIAYYGRYMDDFYIIHHDKETLKEILKQIQKEVEKLGLKLNGKTQIFPLKNGIDFLGFHTYLTESGKVIRKIRRRSKQNMQRKLRKMAVLCQEGKIDQKAIQTSYLSWRGHAEHGNSYHLIHKTDALFQQIMEQIKEAPNLAGGENDD